MELGPQKNGSMNVEEPLCRGVVKEKLNGMSASGSARLGRNDESSPESFVSQRFRGDWNQNFAAQQSATLQCMANMAKKDEVRISAMEKTNKREPKC